VAKTSKSGAKLAVAAIVATILVGGTAATGSYFWASNNAYAAKINGEVVSSSEYLSIVERAKKQYAGQIGMDFNSESGRAMLVNLKENVMNSLVDMTLMKQQAKEMGLSITADEKESQFNEFLRSRYQGDQAALEEALKENRVTRAEFDKQFEDQILLQKLYQKVIADVKADDAELKKFYDENIERFSVPEQIAAQHILLKADQDNAAESEKVRKQAEALIQKLNAGTPFDALAKEHSQDEGSKESGGDLGSFGKGQMVPEFENAVWPLQPGQITAKPVQTNFGWHIIKRGATNPGSVRPFEEVKDAIAAQLQQNKQQETFEAWLKTTKDAAKIKINEKLMAVPELSAEAAQDPATPADPNAPATDNMPIDPEQVTETMPPIPDDHQD